ncbi:PREDICTED: putative disease resistance protein RGA4 [Erythranthe guttata]|uniref:putative disease resistance protein RGA4 n=1 Tax=Erythranthe guttata TaxID=4155 RepID=UPI00064DC4BC|nr:PREDICTED: putative disease resistance protein RGA4 [Erythranthe guttata]|eukprot:XP_012829426.1 PREDICTED: putative disease resistance protein RGA4 [Erythranthe guttata]
MAAEAVLGAAVKVLLQNLISVSGEQISLVRDFKKHFEKLKGSISMIQSFLNDAEKKQVTDESVKLWLKKLERVAFDADNALDELNYQLLSKNILTENTMNTKVRGFFPHYIHRLEMARKIKDIIKNLEEINHEACIYGLQKAVVGANAPADGSSRQSAARETDSFSIDLIFLARQNEVSEIVKIMTTLPNDHSVFSILPIVGMGGLGKSTVARQVFNHEEIKTHFAKRFWVHVSESFDDAILFKKILTSLTKTNAELGNRQALLENLQRDLGNERFLLVLDDVWNDNHEKWDEFIVP